LAIFQRMVDWIYEQFVTKVADARKLDRKAVEEIGQGRVWSGSEAVKLGLVDEIGGFDVALRYAAQKAGLGENPTVSEYPRKKELAEAIADLLQKVPPLDLREHSLVGQVADRFARELATLRAFNDPRGLYARLPVEIFVQ
jgi:protease-4